MYLSELWANLIEMEGLLVLVHCVVTDNLNPEKDDFLMEGIHRSTHD